MFNSPGSTEYIKPQEHVGHVFIIRPLQHIPSVPGFNPKPNGQPSDGILIDGVCLTKAGADGQALSFRGQTWGHSRLIASLKNSIGTLVLGRIAQGRPNPGQQSVPLELVDMTTDPQMVAAAQAWVDAHPGWFDTALPTAQPAPAPAPAPAPVANPAPVGYTFGQQPAPAPVGYAQPVPGQVYAAPVAPAPVAPVGYAAPAPVAPVQPQLPMGAPMAQPAPVAPVAPTQPVQQAAPALQPIAGAVWDQMPPAKQAELAAQGYTRGA